MNVNFLLDKAKEMCNAKTDSALAKKLGVSRSGLSNYRTGVSLPDTVTSAKIAEVTGLPLARVLGIVGEARAISAAEKAVWRKLAQAAIVLIAIAPAITVAAPMSILTDDINNASELPKFAEFLLCQNNLDQKPICNRFQAFVALLFLAASRALRNASSFSLSLISKPRGTGW